MTREEIYAWMDKQIEAVEILNTPLDKEDPFYICVAGSGEKSVHIYHIDTLCEELNQVWNIEYHDEECDSHYFMYKGYKFFGLSRRKTHDRK